MLKHRLFLPLISAFLTAGITTALLFLSPKITLAGPIKGCQWVANIGGTAYNICQEVSYEVNCRKD